MCERERARAHDMFKSSQRVSFASQRLHSANIFNVWRCWRLASFIMNAFVCGPCSLTLFIFKPFIFHFSFSKVRENSIWRLRNGEKCTTHLSAPWWNELARETRPLPVCTREERVFFSAVSLGCCLHNQFCSLTANTFLSFQLSDYRVSLILSTNLNWIPLNGV